MRGIILGGFCEGWLWFAWILIWVGVFLVLDHPTRRAVVVGWGSRRFPTKILLLRKLLLLFLSLTSPAGLTQVCLLMFQLSFSCPLWFYDGLLALALIVLNCPFSLLVLGFSGHVFQSKLLAALIWFIWGCACTGAASEVIW